MTVVVYDVEVTKRGDVYPIRLRGHRTWDDTAVAGPSREAGCSSKEAKQLYDEGLPDGDGIVSARFAVKLVGGKRTFMSRLPAFPVWMVTREQDVEVSKLGLAAFKDGPRWLAISSNSVMQAAVFTSLEKTEEFVRRLDNPETYVNVELDVRDFTHALQSLIDFKTELVLIDGKMSVPVQLLLDVVSAYPEAKDDFG